VIKDDVWIRTNEIIMRKCVIGKGYNIGAGAIVTKSIPPYSEVSAITAQ
jgi:acetyltransferase-like isoleucine patch superfamily enzyme